MQKSLVLRSRQIHALSLSPTLHEGSRVMQQSDAAEACWAHNPEVGGLKPSSAILPWFFPSVVKFAQFLSLHLSFCTVLSLNLDAT